MSALATVQVGAQTCYALEPSQGAASLRPYRNRDLAHGNLRFFAVFCGFSRLFAFFRASSRPTP